MSVNDRIRDSYSALTESEKKIADYFFQEKLIPTQIDIHKAVWK